MIGLAPFKRMSASFFWLTAAGLVILVAGSLIIARSHHAPGASPRGGRAQRPAGRLHAPRAGRAQGRDRPARGELQPHAGRHREPREGDPAPRLRGRPHRAAEPRDVPRAAGQAVRTAKRGEAPIAVLLFDMDRFKTINDTLGHPVGDQALREVGLRVRKALRDSDVIARLGGDEFAVLLADRQRGQRRGGRAQDPQGARGAVRDRGPDHGHGGVASASRASPSTARIAARCCARADVAMYEAKRTKASFAIYDPSHDVRRQEFLTLLGELRRAVEAGELVLHYQPKMNLGREPRDLGGGAGALAPSDARLRAARRLHPVRRADRLHQRDHALGAGARHRAVRRVGAHRASHPHVRERLGARPAERRRAGAPGLRGRSPHAELPAGMLCLEITESALMEDPLAAQSHAEEAARAGRRHLDRRLRHRLFVARLHQAAAR